VRSTQGVDCCTVHPGCAPIAAAQGAALVLADSADRPARGVAALLNTTGPASGRKLHTAGTGAGTRRLKAATASAPCAFQTAAELGESACAREMTNGPAEPAPGRAPLRMHCNWHVCPVQCLHRGICVCGAAVLQPPSRHHTVRRPSPSAPASAAANSQRNSPPHPTSRTPHPRRHRPYHDAPRLRGLGHIHDVQC
jgi:hypothetical protein